MALLINVPRLLSIQKPQIMKKNNKSDTTSFITFPEFNRLTKNYFDAIIKETTKPLGSKCQIDAAIDIADKNRENIKNFKGFI